MISNANSAGLSVSSAPRTYWEKVAETRWGAYVTEVEKRLILKALSRAGPPTKALEVGCEGGRWSKMLADQGWQMTCIDVNENSLAICQQRIPKATCLLAGREARSIPCEANSFDLALCIEVAPVIQSKWFLGEAYRVLKSNGLFVGVTWNSRSVRGWQARLADKLGGRHGDFYKVSYPAWRRALRKTGFKLLYEEGFCWGPLGRASNSPLVPFFVKLERALQLNRLPSISPWVAVIAGKQG